MWKQISPLYIAAAGLLLFMSLAGLTSKPALATSPPQQEERLTLESLQNAEYLSEFAAGGTVTLVDGGYRERYDDSSASELVITLSDTIAYGDLNGDGREDAVVVLMTDPGGSGTFLHLAAVINDNGQPDNQAVKLLGDRVGLTSLTVDNGQIVVEMITHGPDDPLCCPAQEVTERYYLQGDKLVMVGPLIPYSDGTKYGHVDLSGEWVIEPQFDFVDNFSEDVALVSVGEQYGYIDRLGEFVIEPQYAFAAAFIEGLAAASPDQKAGFIDKSGNFVIEPVYDFAANFSEGLAAIGVEGKTGYVDQQGNLVVEPQYTFGGNFSEGLAPVSAGEKFGYIDAAGQMAIEPAFDFANEFSEGLAAVTIRDRVGYIDQTGQLVIEPNLEFGFAFSEGLAYANNSETTGYIDQTGQMVIVGPYNFGYEFSEGLAAVEVDGLYGFIDTSGQMIIEPQFVAASSFEDGAAYVQFDDSTWGYIDQSGRTLFQLPAINLFDSSFQPTQIIPFVPAVPAETQTGACFTNSLVTSIETAWRCTVDNQIYDPCLIGDDGQTLVCGMDPVTGETGFQLNLTEPLPEPDIAAASTSEETGQRLSREALANIAYRSGWPAGGVAELAGGRYTEQYDGASELVITLSDIIAYGDLNGDGAEDAAVVLVTNAGGSGTFYDLAVVLNEGGQPNPVASTFLGDRVVINELNIENGQIKLDMITQGPDDPMCCPATPLMLNFVLDETNDLILSETNAWLLQLADGVTCSFLTGATLVFENERINYGCSDGSSILGGLMPGAVWTAEKVTVENTDNGFIISSAEIVDISAIWQPVNPGQAR